MTGALRKWVAIGLLGLMMPTAAEAKSAQIALTFDDLPGLTLVNNQPYVDYLNTVILRTLKLHHWPAIGFVNEGKLDEIDRSRQIEVLRKWRDAGMELGNHTFSHESPNDLGAEGYIDDIAKGEPVTRKLLAQRHKTLHWFRHPYLETGTPEATKQAIDRWLTAHHYRIAPVTIDADDWEFAEPYDDAISRHDEARVHRIKAEYLAHTKQTVTWCRRAAMALFGRDIAYVMLLHDTRLNADSLEQVLTMLKAEGLKGVSLAQAMKDPAYLTPDPYVGKDGIEWLERWSDALDKELPWDSYEEPPASIQHEYDVLESDFTAKHRRRRSSH